jgi:outer membrane protein OmpA-like peptidoglycan-associated protein
MVVPSSARVLCVSLALLFGLAASADAQINRLKKAAEEAAVRESSNQVDRLVAEAIQCAFDDPTCIEEAESSGDEYVLVDDEGKVITGDDGAPVSDPDVAADIVEDSTPRPGEGAWANYDFVPGEHVLFYEDFSEDKVGDFPRRLEFRKGNWEIIEWEGRRLLRNTGPRYSSIEVILPEELPERFTIETEAYLPHSNYRFIIATTAPASGKSWQTLEGNFFQIGVYAKVYVGERRVANVPNAVLALSDRLFIENTYAAGEDTPILIGPIRVAAGGADLYDALEEEGRVATHGILFAVNSARIRPESTPTLEEIGEMLQDHPDLRLSIEGHTDSDGDETHNQTLSEERAAAVRDYLIEAYGVDPSHLESAGMGESSPVESNDTPEGKQQNRRVELVRLDG